jgi:NADH oxidase (H2O2-forming)
MGQRIVIIGNGIAGNSAAEAIRNYDSDAKVSIISSEKAPLYSPCAFYRYLAGDIPKQSLLLKKLEDYSHNGIEFIAGQKASEVDISAQRVRLGDKKLDFDKLIIANGGAVSCPPVKGVDNRGVFTLKTLDDAETIYHNPAKKVAVMGAGPTGVEVALALSKRGAKVSLFGRFLPRQFDEKPGSIIRQTVEEHGLDIYAGERVTEIVGNVTVSGITTIKRKLECDQVIIGAGVKPNTELASQIGAEVGDLGGIKTDDYMRTNLENIYACGDCVESRDIISGERALNLLWPNAKRQGWTAGCNCAGKTTRFVGSLKSTSLDIFGVHALSIGRNADLIENQNGLEIIEKYIGAAYYRLVVVNNRLAGVQLINNTRQAGMLTSVMCRKDNINELRKIVQGGKLLPIKPLIYQINQYISRI